MAFRLAFLTCSAGEVFLKERDELLIVHASLVPVAPRRVNIILTFC